MRDPEQAHLSSVPQGYGPSGTGKGEGEGVGQGEGVGEGQLKNAEQSRNGNVLQAGIAP